MVIRNIIKLSLMVSILLLYLSGCATEKTIIRLYDGDPISEKEVSMITSGLKEPSSHIGGFYPVTIDGNNKCHLSPQTSCEILPGQHTIQVSYIWYSSRGAFAGSIAGGLGLCLVSMGLTCLAIPVLPPDMGCESIIELNSQAGHTYALNVSEASGERDNHRTMIDRIVIDDVQTGQQIANKSCILKVKPEVPQRQNTLY